MLGQPYYMLTPHVVGCKLTGQLAAGATAWRDLPIPGREFTGVYQAMEFLPWANKAQEGDMAKRGTLLKQANNLLYEDAPVWFFNYNKAVLAYQPWVHGLQANPTEITHQYPEDIWVDTRSTAMPAGSIIRALPKPLAETNKAAATAPMPKAKP